MKISSIKNKFLIGISIILLIFLLAFSQKGIKSFFYSIFSPFQKVFWQAGSGISDFSEIIFKSSDLKKENEELKNKSNEILGENIQLKLLAKENETLRKVLNFQLQKELKLATADVTSRDPLQDFILINKGSNAGLSKGMPVLTEDRAILGRISEANSNFSKIMLISDKLSSFDAKIPARPALEGETGEQKSDIYGVVKGAGDSSLIFDLIPQEKEIKQGDIVVTSSLGGIFPNGLLAGKVKELDRSDIKPHQKAVLEPFFSIKNLEMVFIIINFNDSK